MMLPDMSSCPLSLSDFLAEVMLSVQTVVKNNYTTDSITVEEMNQ